VVVGLSTNLTVVGPQHFQGSGVTSHKAVLAKVGKLGGFLAWLTTYPAKNG
jgi:hypothetical protein